MTNIHTFNFSDTESLPDTNMHFYQRISLRLTPCRNFEQKEGEVLKEKIFIKDFPNIEIFM